MNTMDRTTGFDNLTQAFTYLEGFTNFEKLPPRSVREFKLQRMENLLKRFGNPHQGIPLVHIAGSKGKGSTASFLASILEEAGYKTGLYTSPHVSSYKERITRAGHQFDDQVYISSISRIRNIISRLQKSDLEGNWETTTFELLTLLAFLIFQDQEMTFGVIETGIGGRLDATNVILPTAAILTPVELEHMDILGDTLEKIATEKAGIIKERVPVFSSNQNDPVLRVFRESAARRSAPFSTLTDQVEDLKAEGNSEGTDVSITWNDGFRIDARLSLLGDFQAENAALAATCARHLFSPGMNGKKTASVIRKGLLKATIPGRMEIARQGPAVVLDGAHTPVSIRRLVRAFTDVFPGKRILIFGSVIGKDAEGMAAVLGPRFDHVIISTPGTFRKSDAEAVHRHFLGFNGTSELVRAPEAALQRAITLSGGSIPILVTGSFYMIGDIRKLLIPGD